MHIGSKTINDILPTDRMWIEQNLSINEDEKSFIFMNMDFMLGMSANHLVSALFLASRGYVPAESARNRLEMHSKVMAVAPTSEKIKLVSQICDFCIRNRVNVVMGFYCCPALFFNLFDCPFQRDSHGIKLYQKSVAFIMENPTTKALVDQMPQFKTKLEVFDVDDLGFMSVIALMKCEEMILMIYPEPEKADEFSLISDFDTMINIVIGYLDLKYVSTPKAAQAQLESKG